MECMSVDEVPVQGFVLDEGLQQVSLCTFLYDLTFSGRYTFRFTAVVLGVVLEENCLLI